MPRCSHAAAAILGVVSLVLGAGDAHADPSSSGATSSELRAWGALAFAGGAALSGVGTYLVVEGLAPCPAYHDCSTRPLGVIMGTPLLLVGVPLVVVGVHFFQKAARVDAERSAVSWSIAPMVGSGNAGAAMGGRF